MRERKARDSGTECRYLLFRAGPVDFAIPHDAVTGILPDPPLLPLPSNPDGITGILPHPVMPRYALKGHAVILLVDSILDSANIGAIAIRPVPRRPSQLHRKYACGVWRGRSRPCFLLDLDALLGRRWLAATQSPSADLLAPRFDPPQP
jgi:chemotaxis signal transduction protein